MDARSVERLEEMVGEIRVLMAEGAAAPRLVHALRNLSHLAELLATTTINDDALELGPGSTVIER